MPWSDVLIVIHWWVVLFVVGLVAYPLTSLLFPSWHDRGYIFAKAVGMTLVTWIVYILGMSHIVPFTNLSIGIALAIVLGAGLYLKFSKGMSGASAKVFVKKHFFPELFFFIALWFWSWIKAHEPSLRGLEKFMDYGFMNSILHSTYFPPTDMWYPPYPINYYYFGHMVTAVLTKVSGIDLTITYNLMLATIFALCASMSYSIGFELMRRRSGQTRMLPSKPVRNAKGKSLVSVSVPAPTISRFTLHIAGFLTAFLVTLAGNMQTLYAFTRGYTGDDVKPFWQLFWKANEFWTRLPEGLNTYWYANATRFIPYTIHEFPSYSFAVSDIHGHVLSIPFVLLALALLFEIFGHMRKVMPEDMPISAGSVQSAGTSVSYLSLLQGVYYGFLVGA